MQSKKGESKCNSQQIEHNMECITWYLLRYRNWSFQKTSTGLSASKSNLLSHCRKRRILLTFQWTALWRWELTYLRYGTACHHSWDVGGTLAHFSSLPWNWLRWVVVEMAPAHELHSALRTRLWIPLPSASPLSSTKTWTTRSSPSLRSWRRGKKGPGLS